MTSLNDLLCTAVDIKREENEAVTTETITAALTPQLPTAHTCTFFKAAVQLIEGSLILPLRICTKSGIELAQRRNLILFLGKGNRRKVYHRALGRFGRKAFDHRTMLQVGHTQLGKTMNLVSVEVLNFESLRALV